MVFDFSVVMPIMLWKIACKAIFLCISINVTFVISALFFCFLCLLCQDFIDKRQYLKGPICAIYLLLTTPCSGTFLRNEEKDYIEKTQTLELYFDSTYKPTTFRMKWFLIVSICLNFATASFPYASHGRFLESSFVRLTFNQVMLRYDLTKQ